MVQFRVRGLSRVTPVSVPIQRTSPSETTSKTRCEATVDRQIRQVPLVSCGSEDKLAAGSLADAGEHSNDNGARVGEALVEGSDDGVTNVACLADMEVVGTRFDIPDGTEGC